MGMLVVMCGGRGLLHTSVVDTKGDRHLKTGRTPPTVLSVFLNGRLSSVLSRVTHRVDDDGVASRRGAALGLNVKHVPRVLLSAASHGHASPFTFANGHFRFHTTNSSTGYTTTVVTVGTTVTGRLGRFGMSVSGLVRRKINGSRTVFHVVGRAVVTSRPVHFRNSNCSRR